MLRNAAFTVLALILLPLRARAETITSIALPGDGSSPRSLVVGGDLGYLDNGTHAYALDLAKRQAREISNAWDFRPLQVIGTETVGVRAGALVRFDGTQFSAIDLSVLELPSPSVVTKTDFKWLPAKDAGWGCAQTSDDSQTTYVLFRYEAGIATFIARRTFEKPAQADFLGALGAGFAWRVHAASGTEILWWDGRTPVRVISTEKANRYGEPLFATKSRVIWRELRDDVWWLASYDGEHEPTSFQALGSSFMSPKLARGELGYGVIIGTGYSRLLLTTDGTKTGTSSVELSKLDVELVAGSRSLYALMPVSSDGPSGTYDRFQVAVSRLGSRGKPALVIEWQPKPSDGLGRSLGALGDTAFFGTETEGKLRILRTDGTTHGTKFLDGTNLGLYPAVGSTDDRLVIADANHVLVIERASDDPNDLPAGTGPAGNGSSNAGDAPSNTSVAPHVGEAPPLRATAPDGCALASSSITWANLVPAGLVALFVALRRRARRSNETS